MFSPDQTKKSIAPPTAVDSTALQSQSFALHEEPTSNRICGYCGELFAAELDCCPNDKSPLLVLGQDPLIGSILNGQYKVLRCLGKGGMGAVYCAEHVLMQRQVALKVLRCGQFDQEAIQRFKHEAVASSALNHANIINAYEFGTASDGTPFMVMEYVQGESLSEFLKTHHGNVQELLPLFVQITDALAHAHRRGIIHRDLKPGNVMVTLTEDGSPCAKILDFGIAKLLPTANKDAAELTRTGEVFGSPSYMSPEQARGDLMDRCSDIYSLGCVLYEALTGVRPFRGENPMEVLYKHLHEKPLPFSKACPDANLPIELEDIVFRMLEKKRSARFQSMDEVKFSLANLTAGATPPAPRLVARIKRLWREQKLAATAVIVGLAAVAGAVAISIALPRDSEMPASSTDIQQLRKLNVQASQCLNEGNLDAAEKPLNTAVQLSKRKNVPPSDRAMTLALQGEAAVLNQQPDLGVERLTESLNVPGKHASETALAYRTLAELEANRGHAHESAEKMAKAVDAAKEAAPGDRTGVFLVAGGIYLKQQNYPAAKAAYQQALDCEERFGGSGVYYAKAYCGLGDVAYLDGNVTEAQTLWRKAEPIFRHSLAPNSPLAAGLYRRLAVAANQLRHWQQAKKYYLLALDCLATATAPQLVEERNILHRELDEVGAQLHSGL